MSISQWKIISLFPFAHEKHMKAQKKQRERYSLNGRRDFNYNSLLVRELQSSSTFDQLPTY